MDRGPVVRFYFCFGFVVYCGGGRLDGFGCQERKVWGDLGRFGIQGGEGAAGLAKPSAEFHSICPVSSAHLALARVGVNHGHHSSPNGHSFGYVSPSVTNLLWTIPKLHGARQ